MSYTNSKLDSSIRANNGSPLLVLLLMFTLAACGGDSNNSPTPAPGGSITPPATISSSTPSADSCAQAISALPTIKSFHFVYTDTQTISASGFPGASGASSASGTFSAEGDADLTTRAWHYTASDTRSERTDVTGEWIHLGNKAYHKEGGGWATPQSADALPLSLNSKLNQLGSSAPAASQIKLLASENMAGQNASHCQFVTTATSGGSDTTYDVWVSNASAQVVRFLANRQAESYSLTFSQVNQPVSITAPQ